MTPPKPNKLLERSLRSKGGFLGGQRAAEAMNYRLGEEYMAKRADQISVVFESSKALP